MKNIHVLPTDKPSRLFEIIQFNLSFDKENYFSEDYKIIHKYKNKHIYITSDEKIKEGDWCIDDKYKQPMKYFGEGSLLKSSKKIILTTDQDLIKDGVQAIDDEFLEWFVNNPSCEFVEVQKWFDGLDFLEYKIIIPKEELHSMDDEVECNMCGGYMYLLPDNSIYVCTNSECTRCYEEEDEEPKQETTSEGFHRISKEIDYSEFDFVSFKIGIEWQQEQDKNKYSEEEVHKIIGSYQAHLTAFNTNFTYNNWFEQFKKK